MRQFSLSEYLRNPNRKVITKNGQQVQIIMTNWSELFPVLGKIGLNEDPVMWLWNWLMPIIFGLIKINWLQSLGLCLLCGFLFNQSSSSKSD